MPRLQSILSLILVLVTTLLVSCGSPQATVPPPTYTAEKIEQLKTLVAPVNAARERMSELQSDIEKKNWVDTVGLLRGPLGQLRQEMLNVTRSLLPEDQPQAKQLVKELFGHFERIDTAAKNRNYDLAVSQYREALKDFDAFLNLELD